MLATLLAPLALTLSGFAPACSPGSPSTEDPATSSETQVVVERLPAGALQPQALSGPDGSLHLLYFQGSPKGGNLTYERRGKGESKPLRVNSLPNSAVAVGTIRGARMAIGGDGSVHVTWNGAVARGSKRAPNAVNYTRLPAGTVEFDPQKNLMQASFHLDGGADVAAFGADQVVVSWHASPREEAKTEQDRRVLVARSSDGGATFQEERAVFGDRSGACGCCGLTASFTDEGTLVVLFRSATKKDRGMWMLTSANGGESFKGRVLDHWSIQACPMSSAALASDQGNAAIAWENDGQVYLSLVDSKTGKPSAAKAVPGKGAGRKHPRLAFNSKGEICVVWTEGTGWERGGDVAWQVFSPTGSPLSGARQRVEGLPPWSFAAVWANEQGDFRIVY